MKFFVEVANLWCDLLLRRFCENRETAFFLEYQGLQRLWKKRTDRRFGSPKAGALPTALHPDIYPAGHFAGARKRLESRQYSLFNFALTYYHNRNKTATVFC
ncbi:MAG: hypothetical protein ACI3UZ_07870 [Oscillospiraceae bacterium]